MPRVKLPENTHLFYGASDDLIEVEGQFGDEFGFYSRPGYIHASDGTVVKGEYDPDGYRGKWKFELVTKGSNVESVTHVPAPDDDDDNSDRLTIVAKWDWIAVFDNLVPASHEYVCKIEGCEWSRLTNYELRAIWLIARRACPT